MLYLLHFTPAHAHAQHYIGWTSDKRSLKLRVQHHLSGNGSLYISRIMRARRESGAEPVKITLVRVWAEGTKEDEKRLKRCHNSPRLCPVCKGLVSVDDIDKINLETGLLKQI